MVGEPQGYVLDSFALLAYFEDEPGAETVEQLLRQAERQAITLYLALVNLGEVYYITQRERGRVAAAGQACRGPRPADVDLWLVRRGLRHRRPTRGQGTARSLVLILPQVGRFSRYFLMRACEEHLPKWSSRGEGATRHGKFS